MFELSKIRSKYKGIDDLLRGIMKINNKELAVFIVESRFDCLLSQGVKLMLNSVSGFKCDVILECKHMVLDKKLIVSLATRATQLNPTKSVSSVICQDRKEASSKFH